MIIEEIEAVAFPTGGMSVPPRPYADIPRTYTTTDRAVREWYRGHRERLRHLEYNEAERRPIDKERADW